MFSKLVLLTLFGLSWTLSSFAANQKEATPKLKILGNFGNKTFSYENTALTWFRARSHCSSIGAELAELPTVAHLDFLTSHHGNDFVGAFYWTGGRDIMTPSQLVWNSNEAPMAADLRWDTFFGPGTCAAYRASSTGHLDAEPCIAEFYVLCQSDLK